MGRRTFLIARTQALSKRAASLGALQRTPAVNWGEGGETDGLDSPVGPTRCPGASSQFQSCRHTQPLGRGAHLGDNQETGNSSLLGSSKDCLGAGGAGS